MIPDDDVEVTESQSAVFDLAFSELGAEAYFKGAEFALGFQIALNLARNYPEYAMLLLKQLQASQAAEVGHDLFRIDKDLEEFTRKHPLTEVDTTDRSHTT